MFAKSRLYATDSREKRPCSPADERVIEKFLCAQIHRSAAFPRSIRHKRMMASSDTQLTLGVGRLAGSRLSIFSSKSTKLVNSRASSSLSRRSTPLGIRRERMSDDGLAGIARGVTVSWARIVKSAGPLTKKVCGAHGLRETHVLLGVEKVHLLVKVLIVEPRFADQLVVELALGLHDEQEHVVVGPAGEQDPNGQQDSGRGVLAFRSVDSGAEREGTHLPVYNSYNVHAIDQTSREQS